ncbi:MAG: hypothetical protein IM568_06405 [Flavobacterium sp.]|nr:hypothetical protein [Flavobacterium sp.]
MLHKLLILLVLFPITNFSQTKFTSSKYNYSFIIPDGWHVKDKIYNPDVDAKIVDGKGNSFIVSIKTFPTTTKQTIKQQMVPITTQELEEQFNAIYGTARIVKRGTFIIDLKEFYYLHMLTPFENGLQLYHKQFAYSYGNRVLTIDACSIETYLDETTPAFAIMLDTFKLLNLKNK